MTEQIENPSQESKQEIKQEWHLNEQQYNDLLAQSRKNHETLTELLNRLPAKEKAEPESQPESETESGQTLVINQSKPEPEPEPEKPQKSRVQKRKRSLKWSKAK